MKTDKKALIAIAVGWYVLLDVLLRTTEGSLGTLNSIAVSFRGIVRGFSYNPYLVIGAVLGLAFLTVSVLFIIFLLVRVWNAVISLTRMLVVFFFADESSTPKTQQIEEKNLLSGLFGENIMQSNNGLFWISLRGFLYIWIVILIVTIVTGLINAISGY